MAKSREAGRKGKSEKNKAKKQAHREAVAKQRALKKSLQLERAKNRQAQADQKKDKTKDGPVATASKPEEGQGDAGVATPVGEDGEGDKDDEDKDIRSMEHKSLAEGGVRVKFSSHWKGTVESLAFDPDTRDKYQAVCKELADAMWELETASFMPVLPDGRVGGNLAVRFTDGDTEYVIVSKSGKKAGQRMNEITDFCLVEHFDTTSWEGNYRSTSPEMQPTSDTPLHFAILNAHKRFDWSEVPGAVLHGHALETEEAAAKFGFPISLKETLFSTPADTEAMMELFAEHPYPQNHIFIRKGHGFMLLGKDLKNAVDTFRKFIKPCTVNANN